MTTRAHFWWEPDCELLDCELSHLPETWDKIKVVNYCPIIPGLWRSKQAWTEKNVSTKNGILSSCVESPLCLGWAGLATAHRLISWGQVCTPPLRTGSNTARRNGASYHATCPPLHNSSRCKTPFLPLGKVRWGFTPMWSNTCQVFKAVINHQRPSKRTQTHFWGLPPAVRRWQKSSVKLLCPG